MNNRIHTIVSLWLLTLLWPLAAGAQKLSVNKRVIDVGRTGFEVPVTATFELRNKGSKTLVISEVKPDCGCTEASVVKNNIAPGERFTIRLTYDARQLGHFTKQVAIYSNATQKPVVLAMKGVVLPDVVDYSNRYPYDMNGLLTSIHSVEFDDVKKGEHPEVEISLLNNTEEVMQPNVLHLPPYLTALAMPETLEPGRSGKMILTLNSNNLSSFGLTQSTVYLARKLGDRIKSDIALPVSVVLLPDMAAFDGQNSQQAPRLQLSSDSLVLDQNHRNGTITLTNRGQSPLNISSLQMFTGGMKVKLDKRLLQPGETAHLKVTADLAQLRKSRTRPRVLMITNDPQHAKVVIRVIAN